MTVRKRARVTPLAPVDGTVRRKPRSDKGQKQAPVDHLIVDPRVMEVAKQARRPGQRLVIVDAETVRLVNR